MSLQLKGQILRVEERESTKKPGNKYQVVHVLSMEAAKVYRLMDFSGAKWEMKKEVNLKVDVREDVMLLNPDR